MNLKQIQSTFYNGKPLNAHLSTWIDKYRYVYRSGQETTSHQVHGILSACSCFEHLLKTDLRLKYKLCSLSLFQTYQTYLQSSQNVSSFIFMISFWLHESICMRMNFQLDLWFVFEDRWSLEINKEIIMPQFYYWCIHLWHSKTIFLERPISYLFYGVL